MSRKPDEDYALLECITRDDKIAISVDAADVRWRVSTAKPAPGSLTERIRTDISIFEDDDIGDAVKAFFERMREQGLPGVLDTGNLRAWHETDLDFTTRLTEEIADDLPDIDEDDFRDDDFENHPLAPLREAMVDNCPAFSGEEPSIEP